MANTETEAEKERREAAEAKARYDEAQAKVNARAAAELADKLAPYKALVDGASFKNAAAKVEEMMLLDGIMFDRNLYLNLQNYMESGRLLLQAVNARSATPPAIPAV